jgi:UDP-2,3-diacylglucosamine hydrolase
VSDTHVFIADVHLHREDLAKRDALIRFVGEWAVPGTRLYVLGDLFDVWVGRDQLDDEPELRPVFDALRAFCDAGGTLTVFHGNRDFPLGDHLTREAGAETVPDTKTIELAGQRVHLSHGDLLCTGDYAYRMARAALRNPLVQWVYTHLPIAIRYGFARGYRDLSQRQDALRRRARHGIARADLVRLARKGIDVVICGHVHERTDGRRRLNGRELRLLTLPEWSAKGSALIYANGTFGLHEIKFA